MAKTKTTVRKQTLLPLCPQCKQAIQPTESFSEHLEWCTREKNEELERERVTCQICKTTLKKQAYLVKHMKRQHPEQQESKTDGAADEQSVKGNSSDIGEDPEIILDFEDDEEEADGRKEAVEEHESDVSHEGHDEKSSSESKGESSGMNSSSIAGRITRKPTAPMLPGVRKVSGTVKSTEKPQSVFEVQEKDTREPVQESETADSASIRNKGEKRSYPEEDDTEQDLAKTRENSRHDEKKKKTSVQITYSRKMVRKKKRQEVVVKEDEEVSFESAFLCPEEQPVPACKFNLGDCVKDGIIRPSDICIDVSEDGQLTIDIAVE